MVRASGRTSSSKPNSKASVVAAPVDVEPVVDDAAAAPAVEETAAVEVEAGEKTEAPKKAKKVGAVHTRLLMGCRTTTPRTRT